MVTKVIVVRKSVASNGLSVQVRPGVLMVVGYNFTNDV